MPDLDIKLSDQFAEYRTRVLLTATLAWPTNAASRAAYEASVMARNAALAHGREIEKWLRLVGGQSGLLWITKAPPLERLDAKASDLIDKAMTAGLVLAILRRMDASRLRDGERSRRKALFLVEQLHSAGGFIPGHEREIRRCWTDFQSVAHFGAALLDALQHADANPLSLEGGSEDFLRFLATARSYQEFGLSEVIDGNTLLPDDLWRLPAIPSDGWCPLPLGEENYAALAAYRAPPLT